MRRTKLSLIYADGRVERGVHDKAWEIVHSQPLFPANCKSAIVMVLTQVKKI